MSELSISAAEKLIRKAGNERVSRDASIELRAILEELGEEISSEAIRRANQEKIKTIKKRHIEFAADELEIF